jgi:hypothetical protein
VCLALSIVALAVKNQNRNGAQRRRYVHEEIADKMEF